MESPVDSSSRLDETTVVVQCVSKGYQECSFDVAIGETFLVERKIGDKGRAFKLTDPKRGQLGNIQKEVVAVLWALRTNTSWYACDNYLNMTLFCRRFNLEVN